MECGSSDNELCHSFGPEHLDDVLRCSVLVIQPGRFSYLLESPLSRHCVFWVELSE